MSKAEASCEPEQDELRLELEDYPEVLIDAATVVENELVRMKISAGAAKVAGLSVANRLMNHWGGLMVYFPVALITRVEKRNQEIRRRFNGRNADDLAREYRLSRQRIYQIMKAAPLPRRKATRNCAPSAD